MAVRVLFCDNRLFKPHIKDLGRMKQQILRDHLYRQIFSLQMKSVHMVLKYPVMQCVDDLSRRNSRREKHLKNTLHPLVMKRLDQSFQLHSRMIRSRK